ncbi:MAG: NfeD family protein, partial [Spirochaetaceae bacterium]|nr:NfeD family protein [Spirochaetaceae bacterium]
MSVVLEYLPWFWLGLVVLFTLIEVFTFGLTTVWFALGALVMVFLSALPIPLVWQLVMFLGISSVLLVFTRPLAVKKLKVGRERTNTDSLLGTKALVMKDITEFEKGVVKVHG